MTANGYPLEHGSSIKAPPLPARPGHKADINVAAIHPGSDKKADLLLHPQMHNADNMSLQSTGLTIPELRLFSPVRTADDDSNDGEDGDQDGRHSLMQQDSPPSRPSSVASSFVFEFSDEEADDDAKPLLNNDTVEKAPSHSRKTPPPLPRRPEPDSRPHHQRLYDEALQELQQLELREFIERASKSVDQVEFAASAAPPAYPELHLLQRNYDVATALRLYAEQWLCAEAYRKLPRHLVSSERPEKLSITRSRVLIERIYLVLPPEVLQNLFDGRLASIYRWSDPFYTARLATLYLALWWYDQLPAAIFAYVGYRILKPKIWPPSPGDVRRQLANRKNRSKEAHDLGRDFEIRGQMSELSRSLMATAGVAGVLAGSSLHPRSESPFYEEELKMPFSSPSKRKRRSKYGMYKLLREIMDRFGPSLQMLLIDTDDFCEKCKNLLLWRRPKATKQSLLLIGVWCIWLSILSGRLQLKLFLLWIWFQFFIVWQLQERYPRYRRAMNPVWYLLWNVPNDVDCALEILKEKAATDAPPLSENGHAMRDSPNRDHLARPRLSRSRASSISSLGNILASSRDGEDAFHEYFALYRGFPGKLRVNAATISFHSAKGFRRLSARILRPRSRTEKANEQAPATVLFHKSISDLRSLRKVAAFDIGLVNSDGLALTFSNGETVQLDAVAKRDQIFAFLMSRSGISANVAAS